MYTQMNRSESVPGRHLPIHEVNSRLDLSLIIQTRAHFSESEDFVELDHVFVALDSGLNIASRSDIAMHIRVLTGVNE